MKLVAIILTVWFVASVLFVVAWARFHRHIDDLEVVAEAERIVHEASMS